MLVEQSAVPSEYRLSYKRSTYLSRHVPRHRIRYGENDTI